MTLLLLIPLLLSSCRQPDIDVEPTPVYVTVEQPVSSTETSTTDTTEETPEQTTTEQTTTSTPTAPAHVITDAEKYSIIIVNADGDPVYIECETYRCSDMTQIDALYRSRYVCLEQSLTSTYAGCTIQSGTQYYTALYGGTT